MLRRHTAWSLTRLSWLPPALSSAFSRPEILYRQHHHDRAPVFGDRDRRGTGGIELPTEILLRVLRR